MWTTLGSGSWATPPILPSHELIRIVEAILAVRTYAFLGKQRWLAILLILLLVGETAFLLYVAIEGVHQIAPPPIGTMKGPCTASDAPGRHVVSGFWLAPVAFDLICTFLTVYKVRRSL